MRVFGPLSIILLLGAVVASIYGVLWKPDRARNLFSESVVDLHKVLGPHEENFKEQFRNLGTGSIMRDSPFERKLKGKYFYQINLLKLRFLTLAWLAYEHRKGFPFLPPLLFSLLLALTEGFRRRSALTLELNPYFSESKFSYASGLFAFGVIGISTAYMLLPIHIPAWCCLLGLSIAIYATLPNILSNLAIRRSDAAQR